MLTSSLLVAAMTRSQVETSGPLTSISGEVPVALNDEDIDGISTSRLRRFAALMPIMVTFLTLSRESMSDKINSNIAGEPMITNFQNAV